MTWAVRYACGEREFFVCPYKFYDPRAYQFAKQFFFNFVLAASAMVAPLPLFWCVRVHACAFDFLATFTENVLNVVLACLAMLVGAPWPFFSWSSTLS